MDSGIEVEGMDKLIAKLQTMDDKMANSIAKDALNAGAVIIQKGVTSKIRRSNESKEHVADHITISKMKKKDNVSYMEIGLTNKEDSNRFFYLKFIEWGTVKMSAQAPFGRTLAEDKEAVHDAMFRTFKEGLGL